MTDKQRIDLLEKLVKNKVQVTIHENEIFTVPSQWQKGKTVRELLDVVNDFVIGKRNWKAENWGD